MIASREDVARAALDEALSAEALLLGRRSYEWLALRWPSRTGELADRLNSMPKYVVSSTLEDPEWHNSTVLKGEVVTEVSKLKNELDGDIVVPGSFQLLRTLLEHDLVDELRLKIFPVVPGAGASSFRRDERDETHAPRQQSNARRRHRLPHIRTRPRRLRIAAHHCGRAYRWGPRPHVVTGLRSR